MVCRLCGAANPDQQASCSACGAPLERAPETRRPHRHAEKRTAWSLWLALCLALGAVLGFALVRLRADQPQTAASYLVGVALGALAGGALGALPGPVLKVLRRGWSVMAYWCASWLATRKLSRLRARCEKAVESDRDDSEARVRLAAVRWLQGARDQAEQVLTRLLQKPDGPAVAHHNLGVAHGAAGRWARAVEEFERARPRMSQSRALRWNLGLSRWALGQYASAAEAFGELTELDSGHLPGRNALALALARQGELDKAISEFEGVLAIRRQHPDVLCNLGVIHQSRGALDVAHGYFTGALQRDPAHAAARYNRGLYSMLQGRYHAAIQDFSTLARLVPDHAWGLIQRAICSYRLGQTGHALESVRRALRVAPADFQVRYDAGTLLLRQELIDQAVRELEMAYELDRGNIDVIINLGVATYLTGRLRQALDHFRAAVRLNPRQALARYNCVVANSMLERLDEAERDAEELVTLYSDFPDAYNAIGVIRLLQNRLVEAAGCFRRVADAMPRSAIVRCNLALAYYLEGDLPAAAEQARYATNLDPELAAARDVAGHTAMELNELSEAIGHFRALVKLEPSSAENMSNLALAYYKDDRVNEAIDWYKRALIFNPRSPEGHNDLGLAYAKAKMLEEAVRHLTQVIEWRPDNPVVHSNLGLVYYFKGDSERAVTEWREVTRLSPAYARLRAATRFSAYDDQEMIMRPMQRQARAAHFPPKVAAFRHSFQLALDESDYRLELPWPDLASAAKWQERAAKARAAMLEP